jgi:hypothetical protein
MLTLSARLSIPDHVLFTTLDEGAVVLNTRTNQYFSLDEVGARFWNLLAGGETLRGAYESILDEYEVGGAQLERDLLSLVERLAEQGLVESDAE